MKEFFERDWSCFEKKLMVTAAMMFGIIVGFMFAPIKKGIYCGNNNGHTHMRKKDME